MLKVPVLITGGGGMLGDLPAGRPVAMRGSSHFRFGDGHVVEEWTVFDELDALTQAYRQSKSDPVQTALNAQSETA